MNLRTFCATNKGLTAGYLALTIFQPIKNAVVPLLLGKIYGALIQGQPAKKLFAGLMAFVMISEALWLLGDRLEETTKKRVVQTKTPAGVYSRLSMFKNVLVPSIISLFALLVTLVLFDPILAVMFCIAMFACFVIYWLYRKKILLLPIVFAYIYTTFEWIRRRDLDRGDQATSHAVTLIMMDYAILNTSITLISLIED